MFGLFGEEVQETNNKMFNKNRERFTRKFSLRCNCDLVVRITRFQLYRSSSSISENLFI